MMTHPGYQDWPLCELSSYCAQRELELEILTSAGLKLWLQEQEVQSIGYRALL